MSSVAEYGEEVTFALHAAFGEEEVARISPLPGGRSGAVLLSLRAEGADFVLRRLDPNRPWHKERLERELACMAIACEAGIAPRVRYSDLASGVVIMERLPGAPISSSPRGPAFVKRLADSLRILHDGSPFPARPPIVEVVRFFDRSLRDSGNELPPTILPLMDEVALATARFAASAPCHNDLNPTNIIDAEGSIYFLDWDSACMGDPFLDIGELGVFVFPSPDQQHEFLALYLGRNPSEEESARAILGRVTALGFYSAAFYHVAATGEKPKETVALRLPDLFALLGSQPHLATPNVIAASLHLEMQSEASTDRYRRATGLLGQEA